MAPFDSDTFTRSRQIAVIGSALLAAMAAPVQADVKAGVDAWSAGRYDVAVAEWREPAKTGDADALFNMAQAYRLGRGVDTDIGQALVYYNAASERGHVQAADNLGLLLFQQGDAKRAMPYIKDAAERGDPRAQYVLGLAHFNADHAEKDWVRAYALLTLANGSGLPQAAAAMAKMDQYIPQKQRELAQGLARDIEAKAARERAASLAAFDLAASTKPMMPEPVAKKPAQSLAEAPPELAVKGIPPRQTSDWKVQLGAFGVKGNAERLWSKLSSHAALKGANRQFAPRGKVTVVFASGFSDRTEAVRACLALKQSGHSCLVTKD